MSDVEAIRLKMKAFYETPLGKAFTAFVNAHGSAWQADTAADYSDSFTAGDRATKAWEKEKEARAALMPFLYEAAGVE
jgi:hypothetical protein